MFGRLFGRGTSREETVSGELVRVLHNMWYLVLLVVLAFGLFVLQSVLVGPLFPILVAVVMLAAFSVWLLHLAGYGGRLIPYLIVACLIGAWLGFGEKIIGGPWWPPQLFHLSPWVRVWINIPFLLVYVVFGLGAYSLTVELVDPEHTMRHGQLPRIKPIYPWSPEEFHAGEPLPPPAPRREIIQVESPPRDLRLTSGSIRSMRRNLVTGMNYGEWHEFMADVLDNMDLPEKSRSTTFAEKAAANYKITQTWFNDVRNQLLDQGLIYWIDPEEHGKGLGMTVRFIRQMAEFVAAPSPLSRYRSPPTDVMGALPARTQNPVGGSS